MLMIKCEFLIAVTAWGSHQAPADKCCLNEKTFLLGSWQFNNDVDKSLAGELQTLQTFKEFFFSNIMITIGQITNFWPRITYHKDKAHFLITPTWHCKISFLILENIPGRHRAEVRNRYIGHDKWHDPWAILFCGNTSGPLTGLCPVVRGAMGK